MKKETLMNEIKEAANHILSFPWENEEFYAHWLAQTYYYVSHSTRLLALSAARFGMDKDNLHQRFLKHCQEEKKHERLAVTDLQSLGKKLSDYPELSATCNFYQTQYYWIEHVAPETFFGYIIALEGLAVEVGERLNNKIKGCHVGKTSRFLEVHAGEDPDHLDKALEMIYSDLHGSAGFDLVMKNFKQAVENYHDILRACQRASEGKTLRKVA